MNIGDYMQFAYCVEYKGKGGDKYFSSSLYHKEIPKHIVIVKDVQEKCKGAYDIIVTYLGEVQK